MTVELKELLPFRKVQPSPAVRLLCLPYAGGAAAAYTPWAEYLPASVELCAVELPGHGTRFRKQPLRDMDQLADELLASLHPLFDRPVAIFGHSLGARIAFAMAKREPRTRCIIVSAAPAAHLPPRRLRSALPCDELIRELEALGGTPRQVLADRELMDAFMPTIRADFTLLEGGLADADAQVGCPIHALAAREDSEVAIEDVAAWRERTSGAFGLVQFEGGHFYIHSQRGAVLTELSATLAAYLD